MRRAIALALISAALTGALATPAYAHATCSVEDHWHFNIWHLHSER